MEIPGVASMVFLRTAVNSVRKKRGEEELSTPDFLRLVREKAAELKIDLKLLAATVKVEPGTPRPMDERVARLNAVVQYLRDSPRAGG